MTQSITTYRVLVADPSWPFADKLPGGGRGASKHYLTADQKLMDICREPLPPLERDCVLILWRVSAMVPEAYEVVKRWGFTPKAEIIWRKVDRCQACKGIGRLAKKRLKLEPPCPWCFGSGVKPAAPRLGMGHQVRNVHETAIIATRGKNIRRKTSEAKSVPSVFDAPIPIHPTKGGLWHSAKPPEFYELVERLYPGPYYEKHSRRSRAGWRAEGDEVDAHVQAEEGEAEELAAGGGNRVP